MKSVPYGERCTIAELSLERNSHLLEELNDLHRETLLMSSYAHMKTIYQDYYSAIDELHELSQNDEVSHDMNSSGFESITNRLTNIERRIQLYLSTERNYYIRYRSANIKNIAWGKKSDTNQEYSNDGEKNQEYEDIETKHDDEVQNITNSDVSDGKASENNTDGSESDGSKSESDISNKDAEENDIKSKIINDDTDLCDLSYEKELSPSIMFPQNIQLNYNLFKKPLEQY